VFDGISEDETTEVGVTVVEAMIRVDVELKNVIVVWEVLLCAEL